MYHHIDGLVQDCSKSSVLAMDLLQSCTKPLISNQILQLFFLHKSLWNMYKF